MIALRATATDNNPNGASAFVGIAQPIGIQDGDLLLAAIVTNAADITVEPPDDSWTLVSSTDPAQPVAVWVFWKTAMNEPARWIFALSAIADAEGAMVAYGGADGYEPVEAARSALTAAGGTTTNVPSVSTSVPGEEVVVFLGALDLVDYVNSNGFRMAAEKKQVGTTKDGTVWIERKSQDAVGKLAAFAFTFSSTGTPASAAIAVILRPSPGKLSLDQVRDKLVSALPKGVQRIYDLTATGDYFKLIQSVAQVVKVFGFDLVDLLNVEKFARFCSYLLPDWERAFDLAGTHVARAGTVPQRQAQVVSCWRAVAGLGSSIPSIQGVVGPLLGYDDTTKAEVLGCSRTDLDVKHRYSADALITVANGNISTPWKFKTVDGGEVSSAGVRVMIEYVAGPAGPLEVTLVAPDGTTAKTWVVDLAGQALDLLWGKEFAGAPMMGYWQLWIENNTGSSLDFIPSVIVEGVCDGLNDRQNTAAAIFHWGVYADPAHLGESGVPADFAAARRAIHRLNFSHTIGNLIQSKAPYPGVDSGVHAAIAGECIPCAN